MIKEQQKIIDKDEKIRVYFEKRVYLVQREKICDEMKILCQKKDDKELYLILGWMLAIQAISLNSGVIEFFFRDKSLWSKRPDVKIYKQGDLYRLLKKML